MQVRAHSFQPRDLVAGHVVLDLVNTVTARNAEPIDWLDGYPRLLEWARLSEAFDRDALHRLDRLSSDNPAAAERALAELRNLRELLVDAFTTAIERLEPRPDQLDRLEREWKDAVAHARLVADEDGLRLEVSVSRSGLDYLRHALVLRAVELLEQLPIDRTRICPGRHCGWFFVDRSRGGQRRWCDMATCGNGEKSRRHYARRSRSTAGRSPSG